MSYNNTKEEKERTRKMYNILICDDERDIVAALKIYLSSQDYNIFEAYNGRQALEIFENNEIHLVLTDIMMPELDGIGAMLKMRQTSNVPVIFLSAKSEDTDKILGLDVGADDYITKPFNPVEVCARVKSQLRRYMSLGSAEKKPSVIKIGAIDLDDEAKEVSVDGESVSLTPTEYELLKFLMQNAGKVYSSKELYTAVWGECPYGAENTVAVHVRHLREKIEISPADPRYLLVVWGKGYKFEKGERKS